MPSSFAAIAPGLRELPDAPSNRIAPLRFRPSANQRADPIQQVQVSLGAAAVQTGGSVGVHGAPAQDHGRRRGGVPGKISARQPVRRRTDDEGHQRMRGVIPQTRIAGVVGQGLHLFKQPTRQLTVPGIEVRGSDAQQVLVSDGHLARSL